MLLFPPPFSNLLNNMADYLYFHGAFDYFTQGAWVERDNEPCDVTLVPKCCIYFTLDTQTNQNFNMGKGWPLRIT